MISVAYAKRVGKMLIHGMFLICLSIIYLSLYVPINPSMHPSIHIEDHKKHGKMLIVGKSFEKLVFCASFGFFSYKFRVISK